MTRKPRVFISRTTAGLKGLAERVAEVLRQRPETPCEPIIQTGFYPSTHDVKGMLAEHLQQCDAVICLIGSAYGSGPHDPITKAEQPVHGLKDPRTKDRLFSYTQLELLIARDLGRPIYTFFIQGDKADDWLTSFAPEPPELAQRQQTFITEFAKDGRNTYGTFSQWDQPADPARGLKQAIEAIKFEITVLAGKPTNLPYTSLGTLFKGRDEFLAELRQHLTAEGPVVIKGKRTIHGMGGVGKTRAAIEYAWKHADDYRALLFISADTPEALHRNLAALCGPLVLNLPEQNEKEQALQVEAALRWLKLHPGWFLIIDNVDTDEAAGETKALLDKLTTGHVLITSRISDWTGHVKSLDLDVLSEAASIAFLDERTEERRPKKDDDRAKVAALVQLLDCLALALEQAGAHISSTAISYAEYIALWQSHLPDALAWHDDEKMKYPRSLAITYETSIAQLSDEAKDLFRIFGWFSPNPIPRFMVDSRIGHKHVWRYVGEIERLHLARFLRNGDGFAIHRLNQEISRQQQSCSKPAPLISALNWINDVMPLETTDVRTWPVASLVVPHAISAAMSGVRHEIAVPTTRLLNQAAALFATRASYSEAESLYRTGLQMIEKSPTPDPDQLGGTLTGLAALLRTKVCFDEAEQLMRRSLAIAEAHFGENNLNTAKVLSNLGELLDATDCLPEAESLMRRAITILEINPEGRNYISAALNNLAILLMKTGHAIEAEALIRRALEIDEDVYGENHSNVAVHLNTLGQLLHDTNRLVEAEPLMRRALDIDETIFGNAHPLVAMRLGNLARLYQDTNRFDEAESMIRRSIAIYITTFGEIHPEVAKRVNNLASLMRATHRNDEAERLMRQSLEIMLKFTSTSGTKLPLLIHVIDNYGLLLMEMGQTEEQAIDLIRQLMARHGLPTT